MASNRMRLSWPFVIAAIALEIVGVVLITTVSLWFGVVAFGLGAGVYVVALLRQQSKLIARRANPPR